MNTALLGIGTNLGDRLANLNRAVACLSLLPKTNVTALSHIYETEPVGYDEQPDFLNAVVKLETELSAPALLGACLGIEAGFGRIRAIRNGPRIIDIDLLIYDGVRSDTAELTLPHPAILTRAFVMVPLLDLYPSGRAPMLPFSQKLKEVGTGGIRRIQAELILPAT